MNISIPKIPEKTLAFPAVKEILKGLMLIVLARTQLFGMSPIGIAYAATFSPQNAYIAFIGLCFGMSNFGAGAIRHILTFFIYYILTSVKDIPSAQKRAVLLGCLTVFISAFQLLLFGVNGSAVIRLMAEGVLAGGLCLLFLQAEGKTRISSFAQMVLFGSVLNGISGVIIPYVNVSLPVFCAVFAALCFAYSCELSLAALASGILAFVMSIGSAEATRFFGAFAICSALGSILSVYGKIGVSTGFLCGICVSVLYSGTLNGVGVFDLFAPLLMFSVLPEHIHYKINGFINRRFEDDFADDPHKKRKLAEQLKTMASAVCDLADGVTATSDKNADNRDEIFEKVRSRVCDGCSLFENCKKKEKNDKNMDAIWNTMEEDGYCDLSNMPIGFGQICLRADRFLTEFGHIYELYKQNTLSSGAAKSSRNIMAKQYSEISNVIELLSREIESGEDSYDVDQKVYFPKVTVRTEAKSGYGVSGDTVIYFERKNKFYVILCDGMGSGDDAMHQSRLTARLFEKFLKAGFDKGTSLRMINSALALKADQESFSTVDILEIDTENGECEFLKIGSAQSFIKRKREIEIISSKSLPVGILESVDTKPQRCKVESGDIILMVTDGISEAGNGVLKTDWIKKLLSLEKRKPWEIADLIIVGAKARTRFMDDMTCCVIKIEKKKEG